MSNSKVSKNILFQLSGSIACYKACHVISRLVQDGHNVQVVATPSVLKFVGTATLEGLTGKAVVTDVFHNGRHMDHVHLTKWADLFVLCPATANTINTIAAGLSDDLVSGLFLTHDFEKPYLIFPAMNTKMYNHPTTQSSLTKLRGWGCKILASPSGALACGDVGKGRLLEPDEVLAVINGVIQPLVKPFHILITSGGTIEPIDGVRSISNFSTGKTGVALADYFSKRGHSVTLLRAKTASPSREENVRTVEFETYSDLDVLLREQLGSGQFQAVFHAAAVSDYSVKSVEVNGDFIMPSQNIKLKTDDKISLHLKANAKLLPKLKSYSPQPLLVVGFKLTQNAGENERLKAVEKLNGADLVVHNDLSEITDNAHVTNLFAGAVVRTKCENKIELAQALETFLKEKL